ncbi:hypothetical protein UFOVP355_8 [uncultured Caudovirales phage]|uniref:Uncharacterized protein n=1 Tax=uncultured Caudovirales phage TaxID=2100421 RepID=A0A6J5NH76_9CAUD|nr:hypothetical protein UFOVP355_8 [uncultured Caudovirales phage]CAB4156861.1 hypothetical protein UFOVP677_8 [uncultured Caudovirales phage]
MGHYAKIDELNNVVDVIIVDDGLGVEWLVENFGGTWIETKLDGSIRKQYCCVGGTYNPTADVFISPKPFTSWSLDSNHDWQAPTKKPEGDFYWDESSLSWLPIPQTV